MEFLIENLMKKVYFIDFGFSNKISFKSFSKMPIFTHVLLYTILYIIFIYLELLEQNLTQEQNRAKAHFR